MILKIALSSMLLKNVSRNSIKVITASYSTKTSSPPPQKTFGVQYCLNTVQQYDHENYLCTLLFSDKDKRQHAFSIRAFNVEVSKIASLVTEHTIGQMRLRFWTESIDKCFDNKNSYILDHPVLRELKLAVDANKLTKTFFKRLISARERPANKPFLTIKELEEYSEQTVSSLYYLLLELYKIKDVNVDHAISHLGKAQGIVNLLRAIPLQGRNNVINIPQEVLLKHGVNQERIIRDKENDKGVEECIFEVATAAHQHLEKSRSLAKNVPRNAKVLFLPAIAVDRFLTRLQKANFRLSDKKLLQRDHLLPMALYWNKFRGKY